MTEKKISIINASPKVRKLAREIGADLHLIEGSQREGRINESDIKNFVKKSLSEKTLNNQKVEIQEYDHSEFGKIDVQPMPRIKKLPLHTYKNLGVKFHMSPNMTKQISLKWKSSENL